MPTSASDDVLVTVAAAPTSRSVSDDVLVTVTSIGTRSVSDDVAVTVSPAGGRSAIDDVTVTVTAANVAFWQWQPTGKRRVWLYQWQPTGKVPLADRAAPATAAAAVALKWPLTDLASNAVAAVVTDTNVTVYARRPDGTLGAPVTGTWTSSTGSAADAGLTPTDDGSNFVGIASAPAAGKRCRFYFADTQDVEWVLPGSPLNPQRTPLDRPFGLMVEGGRNHRMVGAHWGFSRNWLTDTVPTAQGQNTPTGTGYYAQWNRCLYLKDWTGVFDIVGMQMQPGNLYEAMNVTNYKPNPRLRIQRSRIDGVTWYNPGTASGHDGGDALQTWHGPTGWLEIDHLSIITDYQGLFLSPYDVGTDNVPAGQSINYTNIRTVRPSGAWVYYNVKGAATVPPTTLDHVFVTDVANPTRSMDGSTGSLVKTANVAPVVSPDGATATWTGVAGSGTTGSVTRIAAGVVLPGGIAADYALANVTGFAYDASWSGWAPSGS